MLVQNREAASVQKLVREDQAFLITKSTSHSRVSDSPTMKKQTGLLRAPTGHTIVRQSALASAS